MNLQTILYFSSILLTCLLTGFLVWYAWKHRHVPGSSAYGWLALSEYLLALTEILSVLSSSMAWALFWFRFRYIIGVFIAVFWLVFALEYSGRKEWISKRLLAGLFIIPLITQILNWSNSLHGIWMRQEVGFHQSGIFWIADTTSRIPGFGYLTLSFYNMLLTLVGIALMLLTAWAMRHKFIAQALLLAGAGLTALVFVVNSIFGIFPKTEFNIFTPGIGLSVLLIALSVFRYEFLKHAPAQESALQVDRLDAQGKYSLTIFILTFILFTSGLAAVSYLTYQNYEKQFRAQVEDQLSAIAELKMNGLVNWRAERAGDAESFHNNPAFAALVQRTFENPDDRQAKDQLQTWLDATRNSYGYDRVFLLDTRGLEYVSSPATPEPVSAHLTQEAAAILKTDQVTFLDLHRDSPDGAIHLALLVPIYVELDMNRPLGLLVLRIDPKVYLYPYINQWPILSATAETLLVRRDGNDILYLNELKFQQNAALNLRIPLEKTQVLSIQAVLGKTGIIQGVDYRGADVIGYAHAIPNSPWYLVARMDTAEVYEPLRARLWQTILFFSMLVLVTGATLMLVWRQQRIRFYHRQIEAAVALRASEEKFRLAFETSPDSVVITRMSDGMFVSVNKGFEQITGYTRDKIVGKTSLEINVWKDPEDRRKIVEGLKTRGEVRDYEAPFLTRDGEIIGLMSAAIIELNGEPHVLNITHDITERKQMDQALKESEERWRRAIADSPIPIMIHDEDDRVLQLSAGWTKFSGYDIDDIPTLADWTERAYGERSGFKKDYIDQLFSINQTVQNGEWIVTAKDGSTRIWDFQTTPLGKGSQGRRVLHSMAIDITERKQAEEKLRENEFRLRAFFRSCPLPITISRIKDQVYTDTNTAYENLTGFRADEIIGHSATKLNVWIDIQRRTQMLKDLQTKRSVQNFEFQLKSRDDTLHDMQIWAEWIELNGEPHVFAIAEDITERKQAEEKLHTLFQRFQIILSSLYGGILVVGNDNRVEFANRAFCELFDLNDTSQDLLGLQASEITQKITNAYADPPKEIDRIREILASGQPVNGEEIAMSRGRTYIRDFIPIVVDGKLQGRQWHHRDITERKQNELEVTRLTRQLELILESAGEGIYNEDLDGKITFANPVFARMLGWEPADLLGKHGHTLCHHTHADGSANPVDECQVTLALLDGEAHHVDDDVFWRKDGTRFAVEYTSTPLCENGQVTGIVVVVKDITERKRAENAQKQSELLFRSLFELSPDAVVLLNPHDPNISSPIVDCNAAACLMNGYQRDELIGHSIDIVNADPYTQDGKTTYLKKLRDEGTLKYEVFHRRKNGVVFPVEISTAIIKVGERELVIGIDRDITERKQAEESIRYQASLLANVNDAITASDEHSILKSWNRAAETMFGWKAEEVIGRPGQDIFHTEFIGIDRKEVFRTVNQTGQFHGEMLQYRKDGTPIFVEANTFTLRDDAGNVTGYVTASHDITERKRAEEALRESEERLKLAISAGRMGTWDRDFLSGQLNWSVECKAMFGLSPETEMNDERFMNALHPEDRASTDVAVRKALENQTDFSAEYRVIWADGTIHWIASQGHGYYNEAGQVIHMAGVTFDITERKQAEEKLRETNEYLENLFNYANAPIIVWDPQFRITRFNHAFETLTGRSAVEVLGKPLELLFPPSLIQASMSLIQKTLSGERWEVVEISIRHVDGSIRTVLWNSATLFSADGKTPFATIAQGQDITERKQVNEKLVASEVRYRRLFEAAKDGILILDADTGMIVDANPFLIELLGFSYNEFQDKKIWELGFFKDIVANQANFLELQQNEYIRYEDMPLETMDGRRINVEFVSNVYQVNHHKVVQCNIRDITARKQAETQLAERHATLNAILESAATPVFSLDRNYQYTSFNSAHAAVMKALYGAEIEIGKDMLNYQFLIEDRDKARKNLDRALSGEQITESAYSGEAEHDRRYFEITHNPIRNANGEVIGVSVFVNDITERKQAEESLQEYNARLEAEVAERTHELREIQEQLVRQERLATLGQLAGSIGHELRNPLGVISNAVYFLKLSQPNAGEIVKEYLDIIEKETRTSDKIVTDLLDFTRIKSLDRQPVSVPELIHQALERNPAPESVETELEISADLPQIYVDPQHIIQVLGNLISNAFQSMIPESGISTHFASITGVTNGRKLKVSAVVESAMIKIDIQDMGVGISPENMKKIFEPLFTTKIKGIGLGLAVSRKLTEANGGRVDVESEEGKGSTFTVYLPVYKESK